MEPETLVTFLFNAPPEVRMVELLGSWDNFTRAYRMFHDRRRGLGHWSGCFSFTDIVFDGHSPNWSQPRSGALKQGGTYWYYFRLDDQVEAFDDALPATSECPLLPGQLMNLLHVPKELATSPSRSRSASASIIGSLAGLLSMHTLDPASKYAVLNPPPSSKMHARCTSDIGLRSYTARTPVTEDSFASPDTRPVTRRADSCSFVNRPASSPAPKISLIGCISDEPDPAWVGYQGDSTDPYFVPRLASPCSIAKGPISFEAVRVPPVPPQGTRTDSIGPESVRDLQFFSSLTSSAQVEGDRLLRVRNAGTATSSEVVDGSQDFVRSPEHRLSGKYETTSDLASPCFSAATLSSNGGGLNTPFRLSGGCPTHLGQALDDKSLEDISARLRSFDVQTEGGATGHVQQLDHTEDAEPSCTTAGKGNQIIYHKSARTAQALHVEASFSHAVFDELAYLGVAIH
ncbi:hypothetical protein B0A48_09880 [Cryoendolithus antarcticus]|uniref:Uncharacterized protein n=1 Tax=Cryoendolithus antarcticus TaxID=1507870 RepID=A0A1V8T2Z2_9PEZI|nr:hypothetical protein B0A48_09880 [Cryoendolithus antarcticus]